MFLVILAVAGVLTVFFSSAYFLYRSYFARGSSFFSYSAKIAGFYEGMADERLPNSAVELSIIGSGGVTLKGDFFTRGAEVGSAPADGCDAADNHGNVDDSVSANSGRKLVVIVPGYGDSVKTVYAPAAEYLKHGFDVLIVYPRGIGKSGGKSCGLSCVDAKDLVRWLKYLSKRLGMVQADGDRKNEDDAQTETQSKTEIILHGFSFGASAVIQSLSLRAFYKAKLDKCVSKVIADSAFTSLHDVFKDYYTHFTKKNRFQRFFFMRMLYCMSFISFLSGKNFFGNISPIKSLKRRERLFAKSKKIKIRVIPILFLHGKNDTVCRFEMAEKLFASSGSVERQNRIVLFDEASHGGSFYTNPKKYMENILSL
jgi:pimeloyl-ACP methyl ester carboxylesterase